MTSFMLGRQLKKYFESDENVNAKLTVEEILAIMTVFLSGVSGFLWVSHIYFIM